MISKLLPRLVSSVVPKTWCEVHGTLPATMFCGNIVLNIVTYILYHVLGTINGKHVVLNMIPYLISTVVPYVMPSVAQIRFYVVNRRNIN